MTLQLHIIILPIVTLLLLAVGGALIFTYYKVRKDSGRWRSIHQEDWSHEWLAGLGWILSGFGALLLLATAIALIPFNSSYWVLTQHDGAIASMSNRFVEGSGDITSQVFTITLDGESAPLVVDDSRIVGLQVGDDVSLTCALEWVYGGADQQNCYLRSF